MHHHRSRPVSGDSKFGTGKSWEEDEEKVHNKKTHRMQRMVDEYNDEAGGRGTKGKGGHRLNAFFSFF